MPSPNEILRLRLERQLIERPNAGGAPATAGVAAGPADVVARLCALQAQDYAGALWSIGLRSGDGCTVADVERAITERRIVRTWPMRGTLHFLAPDDVRWMLALLAPQVIGRAKTRHAQLGITEDTIERARAIFTEALSGDRALSRTQMMALLETHGIDTGGPARLPPPVDARSAGAAVFRPQGRQATDVRTARRVDPSLRPARTRPRRRSREDRVALPWCARARHHSGFGVVGRNHKDRSPRRNGGSDRCSPAREVRRR